MNNSILAALLERDIDDISKAAITLDRHDRRQTLELAAQMLHEHQARLRALKILGFVQAALSMERNGQFPAAQSRAVSTAVMKAASNTDATDVHRAAIDVMTLLSVKAYAERNNLRVLARLMEQSPRDPLGFAKESKQRPVPEPRAGKQMKTRLAKQITAKEALLSALKKKKARHRKADRTSARRKHGA